MYNADNNLFVKKVKDWIYFCAEEKEIINLYRFNTDGTRLKKLAENCDEIRITDDYIFYAFIYDDIDNTGIYRINLDGSDKVKICADWAGDLNIVDDWIFYRNLSDVYSAIYKIKIDGSERTKINSEISQEIIVHGEWIYFQNVTDNYKPYKIRLDGSERTKLSDIESSELYLCQASGNIYATVLLE